MRIDIFVWETTDWSVSVGILKSKAKGDRMESALEDSKRVHWFKRMTVIAYGISPIDIQDISLETIKDLEEWKIKESDGDGQERRT